eukprot:CAMPEP_0168518466 /NCGR_PEP_ID=MMETSP0405-20121227/6728_1 /TAXON_ID=498012 /ORGANISM="Trichosphaerium sp, Strain Am-I-7 wt" /LENGTH=901 /DNA_ID=CAMNT_0008538801 /DNA_START=84 /DNA_END=2789 /DNA_ORIENTATION=+
MNKDESTENMEASSTSPTTSEDQDGSSIATARFKAVSDLLQQLATETDTDQIFKCLTELRCYSKGDSDCKLIIGGSMAHILRLLVFNNREIRKAGAKLLRSVSVIDDNINRLSSLKDIVPRLLHMLAREDEDIDTRIDVCAIIWNLSSQVSNKVKILDNTGIPLFVNCLQSDNVNLQWEAIGVIKNLSCSEDLLDRIEEGQVIEAILELLKDADKLDATLVIALCSTLWNLSVSDMNKVRIVKSGGLTILTKLMHSKEPALQREVVGVLKNLTLLAAKGHDPGSVLMESESGGVLINKLITLLDPEHAPATRALSAAVLANLANSPNNNKYLPASNLEQVKKNGDVERAKAVLRNSVLTTDDRNSPRNSPDATKQAPKRVIDVKEESVDHKKRRKPTKKSHSKHESESSGDSSEDIADTLKQKLGDEDRINWKDITIVKKIGKGQYGEVWLASYHEFPVACKIIKKELQEEELVETLEELSLMKRLKHPNVVMLMGACLDEKNRLCIITELATRGDLKKILTEAPPPLYKRLEIGRGIASGLAWLHAHNIVHRDLKMANLLVSEDWTVKISDFGLSLRLTPGAVVTGFGGNLKYSAPEILRARESDGTMVYPYSEKSDIYSYSLLLWELVAGTPVFPRELRDPPNTPIQDWVLTGHRPPLQNDWPDSLKALFKAMWSDNIRNRPKFNNILKDYDTLMIDVLCTDPFAKRVAEAVWTGKRLSENVPFHYLLGMIKTSAGPLWHVKKRDVKSLNAVLCNTFDDTVSFERFCYVMAWFAPVNPITDFFKRLTSMVAKESFHGFYSEEKAEARVKQLWESTSFKRATYVYRFGTELGGFVLTYISRNGDVRHIRFVNHRGKYIVKDLDAASDLEFDSITSLSKWFKSNLKLKRRLPDSPFISLTH